MHFILRISTNYLVLIPWMFNMTWHGCSTKRHDPPLKKMDGWNLEYPANYSNIYPLKNDAWKLMINFLIFLLNLCSFQG